MKKYITLLLLALLFHGLNIYAADRDNIEKKQKKFARELFSHGRYFEAIGEAAKLDRSGDNTGLNYFIYSAYYKGEQYRTVIHDYIPGGKGGDLFPGFLLRSRSYFMLGDYENSRESLGSFRYSQLDQNMRHELFIRRTESFIKAAECDLLRDEILLAGPFLKDDYNFSALRRELEKYNQIGLKSPLLAGGMSAVVPGLGQIYSGRIMEGLISLAAVASTFAGAMHYRAKGMDGESRTLFFFSGLFYSGNIYGAVNSARNSNVKRGSLFLKRMSTFYTPYFPEKYINMRGSID